MSLKLLSLQEMQSRRFIMSKINRLKVVLAEKDKTSKWLAETLERDTATVSRWCNNHVQPSLETLDKIAKLLGVDRKDLINSSK